MYKPDVAIISGIAWDHINVFPTFENYVEQFEIFCSIIEPQGILIYNSEDEEVNKLGIRNASRIKTRAYQTPKYDVTETGSILYYDGDAFPLQIFGGHNLQNLMGAMNVALEIGIEPKSFFKVMASFMGAGKRLEKLVETEDFVMYKDFAHSPSKLKATTIAVKEQYQERTVIACMELHTFSSLKKEFLPQYKNAMDAADIAMVYFSPEVVKHKKLEAITIEQVKEGFGGDVLVLNDTLEVRKFIDQQECKNAVLLMMSSGNFDGINYEKMALELTI